MNYTHVCHAHFYMKDVSYLVRNNVMHFAVERQALPVKVSNNI